jgi:centromeric protein E
MGMARRQLGKTRMNEMSSRSHTIFKLIIESKKIGDSRASTRVSNLNFVDLAGSEMTAGTANRMQEGKHINKSLLTLSVIIKRLSEEKPDVSVKQYLPYRDSKLTRILQPSLSGNARISVICTISPARECIREMHSTLKFASRAKKVKTNATIDELEDEKILLTVYKSDIRALKDRLAIIRNGTDMRPSIYRSEITEIKNSCDNKIEDVELIRQVSIVL